MAYLVDLFGNAEKINYAPASVVEEVLQNVRVIVSTIKGTVPLYRSFGISGDIIDLPINQAKARFTNEIIQAVRKYEPRAKIERITFRGENTGELTPLLEVSVNES